MRSKSSLPTVRSIHRVALVSLGLLGQSAVLPLGIGWSAANAQDESPCSWFDPCPIKDLPDHVVRQSFGVELLADFAADDAGAVTLYLANFSSEVVTFDTQDGDPYLKMEYKTDSGGWVRAESHSASFCGNSYMKAELEAGFFVKLSGYVAHHGSTHSVRYRLWQQTVEAASNVGSGLVDPEEVERASQDVLNVKGGSLEFIRDVALGKVRLVSTTDYLGDLQSYAVRELSRRFDGPVVETALEELAAGTGEMAVLAARLLENEPGKE